MRLNRDIRIRDGKPGVSEAGRHRVQVRVVGFVWRVEPAMPLRGRACRMRAFSGCPSSRGHACWS